MRNYDDILKDFIKSMNTAKQEYEFYSNKVTQLDRATQDLLHQIELGSTKERNKWATQLSQTRKERRYAKDKADELEPIYDYIKGYQPHIKNIERLLGDVRKKKNLLKNRKYSPKVIKNLTMPNLV